MAKKEDSKKIWMDGKLINWGDANVHVLTHSLHYGLGAFEGVRCYKGENGKSAIFRLKEHTERLFDSCRIMQMEVPFTQDQINKATVETVRANGLKECYIRPIVFLGDGSMGVLPKQNPVRVAIAAWEWGAYLGDEALKKGIKTRISSFTRHHVNVSMTRAKITGHYVNSILAKREAVKDGYDEGILLDPDGYVAEGSGENIFIVRKGVLKTTPLTSVLDGITRASVMKIAEDLGLKVIEERFTRDALYIADEAFFTGTAAELTPIREVDGRSIGEGKPGPITKKIQEVFFDAIRGKNKKYASWLTHI